MSIGFRIGRAMLLALAVVVFLGASHAAAGPITYAVTVDTSLVHGLGGALEFQYNSNVGDAAGQAVISSFHGGALSGSPLITGDASGTISPGPLTIHNTPGLNDVLQDFTFGNHFSFDVTLSGTGSFALTLWDGPTSAVLGGSASQLFAASPDGSALRIDVTESRSGITSGTVTHAAQVTATLLPEPSTLLLVGAAAAGLLGRRVLRAKGRTA
jgi:hypothetical protein